MEEATKPGVRQAIREKYGIAKDDFLIVTGGKIDRWKRQTLLLMDAVRKITDKKLKLIVFGSVEDEIQAELNQLCDDKRVQFVGWVTPKDTYRYFAAADLVAFPGRHSTLWEEAAAIGIPLLCKDIPGTHHVDLGGNVRFLKEDSTEEIQNVIENLLNNPEEYQQMKKIATEKGKKAFSYREIAKIAIEQESA